jgi:hypothetical protein
MKKLQGFNDELFQELSRNEIKNVFGGDTTHGTDCCTQTFNKSTQTFSNDGSDPYTDNL